jgi:hypothetical protein
MDGNLKRRIERRDESVGHISALARGTSPRL